jgi:hypothetical protein
MVSAAFEEFISLLGERVQLKNWTGYRGGLDVQRTRPLHTPACVHVWHCQRGGADTFFLSVYSIHVRAYAYMDEGWGAQTAQRARRLCTRAGEDLKSCIT